MGQPAPSHPPVTQQASASTAGVLRAMNRAFAKVVVENYHLGLPVIQLRDGKVVETPAAELLPQAQLILACDGEMPSLKR